MSSIYKRCVALAQYDARWHVVGNSTDFTNTGDPGWPLRARDGASAHNLHWPGNSVSGGSIDWSSVAHNSDDGSPTGMPQVPRALLPLRQGDGVVRGKIATTYLPPIMGPSSEMNPLFDRIQSEDLQSFVARERAVWA